MRNLILGVAAAMSLLAAGVARAEAPPQLIFGVDRVGEAPLLVPVQYIYLGHNYCWYDGGWRGPGFYWCGYAWRRGFGWGGGYGWRGWHGGHGRHGGGHGGGYRGGGGHGGGHGGGGGGHHH